MKEPLYKLTLDGATLHLSKGNSKIGKGIWSFSTIPGNAEHIPTLKDGTPLTDVPGTCSKYCDGCAKDGACYAWRDLKLHRNVTVKAWGENTLLLRSGKLWDELETFLTLKNGKAERFLIMARGSQMDPNEALKAARKLAVVKTFRIHVSGELESASQLRRWNLLALVHPEIQFGIYTKNFDALGEFLDSGTDFADNLVVNVSGWHGVEKPFLSKYSWAKLNVFVYDDSLRKGCGLSEAEKEELAAMAHCPAVGKDGRHAKFPDGTPVTCDHCGRCYRKTGMTTAVYAH